jgi:hypothetical protein
LSELHRQSAESTDDDDFASLFDDDGDDALVQACDTPLLGDSAASDQCLDGWEL